MRLVRSRSAVRPGLKPSRYGVAAALLLVLPVGCGQKPESASHVKHDANLPTRGNYGWMWQEVTDADYRDKIAPLLGVAANDILPSNHKLTKKTQALLDLIDESVRRAHATELAQVPRPRAKVLLAENPNAFVAPVPVCYQVPVKVRTNEAGKSAARVFFDLTTGEVSAWPAGVECVDASGDGLKALQSVAEKFNAVSRDCQLALSADHQLVPSVECKRADDLDGITGAKSVAILQTANQISVHSSMFSLMSEEAFVGVLAHELGHYYRSHITAHQDEYGFFYTLTENQPANRPTPEPGQKDLGQGAVASSTLLGVADVYSPVPRQTLRSELYFSVGSVVSAVCKAGDCPAACQKAKKDFASSAFKMAIDTFPFAGGSAQQDKAYGQFEAEALACLEKLTLVEESDVVTGTSVSIGAMQSLIKEPIWPQWLFDLPDAQAGQVAEMNALLSERLAKETPKATDLKSYVIAASHLLTEQDEDMRRTLKQAFDLHLGQYTTEQEADEEAAEWLAGMGLSPSHVVEAMHSLGAGADAELGGMVLSQADCDDLWKRHWQASDGSYAFVPIGDYSEIHHSICYRMFNLEREIKAHKEEPASGTGLPPMGGEPWRQLQTLAKDVHGVRVATVKRRKVNSLVSSSLGCIYSYGYH